jgi:hypothetical protein
MKWEILGPLLVTTVVALAGWLAAHRLSAYRDRVNKRREVRVQNLVECYRKLSRSSNRRDLPSVAEDLESAVADIQLFGTEKQANQVGDLVKAMKARPASADDLMKGLRDEVRSELCLPKMDTPIWTRLFGGSASDHPKSRNLAEQCGPLGQFQTDPAVRYPPSADLAD